ncbi:MAG: hypothetical protein F9K40_01270 [Kofleriaceae bacterium]|nr:MAG: hypothetical protein F9K40_01270 [Kofleriaceae bacterium]
MTLPPAPRQQDPFIGPGVGVVMRLLTLVVLVVGCAAQSSTRRPSSAPEHLVDEQRVEFCARARGAFAEAETRCPNSTPDDMDCDGIPDGAPDAVAEANTRCPNPIQNDTDCDGIPDTPSGAVAEANTRCPEPVPGDTDCDGIPENPARSVDRLLCAASIADCEALRASSLGSPGYSSIDQCRRFESSLSGSGLAGNGRRGGCVEGCRCGDRCIKCSDTCHVGSTYSGSAPTNTYHAVYGAFDARGFYSTPVSTSLAGVKAGWQFRKAGKHLGGFAEAGYLRAGSADFYLLSIGGGGRFVAVARGRIELGGQVFVEVQNAHLDRHRNVNILAALGGGGYAEVRVLPHAALTLTLSANAFLDVTPPTKCNDGSWSQSTGQGTCSHHGGIDFYTDKLGEGVGLDALIGIQVWFGDR